MLTDIKYETEGKVRFPQSLTAKELKKALIGYIRGARRKGIHVVITHTDIGDSQVGFCFNAEHISKKGFLCQKRFRPDQFTVVDTVNLTDNLAVYLEEKSKRIERYYGDKYEIRIVAQILKEGDDRILLCLLASKSG